MNISRPARGLLLLVAVGGCAAPRVSPPDVDALGAARPPVAAIKPNLPDVLVQLLDAPPAPPATGSSPPIPARNVLVLSGGGKDGAFSAGVLTGWSASGTRPTFDVVTGVSTGALIAPLAFLGSRYDQLLRENYTGVRTKDVYRMRPWLSVLWSDALADSSPLQRRIDAQVTDEFLAEIARAHAAGRRLYIGTTNLDTGRLVYWDMGAIAAGTDPNKRDLFRKVLLASCSIPGLLPPVPIEIAVDGRRYT
jgi:predicted acylesterase/phospholipase RssA